MAESEEEYRIIREMESLNESKRKIDDKISLLQARLVQIRQNNQSNKSYGNELSSHDIYRYSRHLLLPSFAVQGYFYLFMLSILIMCVV